MPLLIVSPLCLSLFLSVLCSSLSLFFTGRVVYLESLQAMSKELDELQLSLKTSTMLQAHIPDELPSGIDSTALGKVVPMHFNLHSNLESPKRQGTRINRRQSFLSFVHENLVKQPSGVKLKKLPSFIMPDETKKLANSRGSPVRRGRKGSSNSSKHFKKKTAKIHEDDLNEIFLFHRPYIFFRAVEAVQLFMVFYISVAATQIIPLVIRTEGLSLSAAGWFGGCCIHVMSFHVISY